MTLTEEHRRILRAYGAGSDLVAIATNLGLSHARVSHVITDIAKFNRAFARTLASGQVPARPAAPPVRRLPPSPVVPPAPPPAPPPDPAPEPEPPAVPAVEWWLCRLGRRYRVPGPHGAPERCSCRLAPSRAAS